MQLYNQIFALTDRFRIPDTIVSNNGTQFMEKSLKTCEAFSI